MAVAVPFCGKFERDVKKMTVDEIKAKYHSDESMDDFRKRLEKGIANKGKIDSANKKLDSLVSKYESLANELVSVQKQINTGYSELHKLGGDNFGLPGKMARIANKIKSSMER